MQRVRDNQTWSLICPSVAPELQTLYGSDFEARYRHAELKSQDFRYLELEADPDKVSRVVQGTIMHRADSQSSQRSLGLDR